MKFAIRRTSNYFDDPSAPCDGALPELLTPYTDCSLPTVAEAKAKQQWVRDGIAEQMDGFVRVYSKKKRRAWVVKIKNLKQFVDLCASEGEIIIKESGWAEVRFGLEIYDDYRE